MTTRAVPCALLIFGISITLAQDSWAQPNLIQREIDSSIANARWQAGPFRFTPQLRLGSGYDSNGLSEPGSPEGDVNAVAAPGMTASIPFGNRALFEIFEELNFVYYRELADLRDIYNVTRVGGAVGGRRFVVRAETEYRQEKARHSSELDIPLDQESNRVRAEIGVALGWRHEMDVSYQIQSRRFREPDLVVDELAVGQLLDRVEHDVRLRLTRHMTAKTDLVVEGLYRFRDFDDEATDRNSDSSGLLAGFAFAPDTNVQGQILLGYKRLIPRFETQADFTGLVSDADFGFEFGDRFQIRGLYTRDIQPSILEGNLYFVQNRYGGGLQISITSRLTVQPNAQFGRNTYPEPVTFLDDDGNEVTELVADDFQLYSLAVGYRITDWWSVNVAGNYDIRDSNLSQFTKDRFYTTFGVTAGF